MYYKMSTYIEVKNYIVAALITEHSTNNKEP